MKYELEKAKGEVTVNFSLTQKEWDEQIEKAYLKERSKINLPGFRKGQAPRKMIEKMYGPTVFFDEAFNGAFYAGYSKFLSENPEIVPVDDPKIEIGEIKNGITFTAVVTLLPEVTLGDYKGMKLEKAEYTVTAEDVEAELKKVQEQGARRVEVLDRAVAEGDIVTLDYKGVADGVAFAGGTAENQELTIGSHAFIAGFEEQMVGMSKGETKDLNVTFPEQYHSAELAGKPAVFTVTVKNIEVKELPEIGDEWAKEVSKFDSLAEYKADIEAKLADQFAKRAEGENENKLITAVVNNAEVEIPQCMIDRQMDYIVRDFEYRLNQMYRGLKMEEYLKYSGMTMDDFKAQNAERAKGDVKSRLVFEQIIKTENLTVSDEAYGAEVAALAQQAGKEVADFTKTLTDDYVNYIKNDLLMRNLLAFLQENNELVAAKEEKAEKTAKKTTAKKKTEKAE